MSISAIIGIVVIIAVAFYLISIYNKLVSLKNRFKNAFAQIDVQLQRRHDLIPNLVETAKAFMKHEQDTLEKVMQARNQAINAQQAAAQRPEEGDRIKQLSQAEGMLNRALANFYAVSENYPDIKANQTMQQLMEELTSTENKVGFARQAYNDAVMTYHTYREQFPSNLIASFFGFKETEMFEVESAEARQAVKVSFN
ncbi:LemA family protein [Hahella sp. CR1]|uniref:LemA family protein n=1 Tax=Hahella sp. CR1 TaxID=2992807 RepID=UPI002443448A|nr:LemA family protein [Hahella sp. CR1]MDG9667529.1 LemA family protein [Hahella sp. CR1]